MLVHGAGGNHLVWPAQLRHLAATAVYALDLPGHGASPRPGCATISAYTEVIRDFVDALELPWFVLAGHSMGGAIALDFGLAYAHRLAGIALVGTGARLRVAPAILDQLHNDFHDATAFIVEHSYHPATSAAEKARYLELLRENDPQVLYGDFVASNAFDVLDQVASLELPTLILCGQQDQMTPPKYSQALHERIAGSELHLVEQAGHNVIVEQPEVVAAHFARFLARSSEIMADAPSIARCAASHRADSPLPDRRPPAAWRRS